MKEERVKRTKEYKKEKKWDYKDLIGYEKDDDPECIEYVYDEIAHITDKGGALLKMRGDKIWIPISQIVDATEDTVFITPWIAKKVGLG